MIMREQIEEMFEAARNNPKYKWDIDSTCRWSYFFTDKSREKLLEAASVLESQGYECVGILEPTATDDDQETLFLQLDKVEKHSVDSLLQRNTELYMVAEDYGLQSYDGMDVGPS